MPLTRSSPTVSARQVAASVLLSLLVALSSGCLVEGLDGDGFGSSCQPHFEEPGDPCELACDASGVVRIEGARYCTQECNPDNSCPAGHVCVRFAVGDVPESACLPPCGTGADCPSGFLGLCSTEGVCGL